MARYTYEFTERPSKEEWTMYRNFRTDKIAMFYGCFVCDMFDEDPEILMEDPEAYDDSFDDYLTELKEVGEYQSMTREELEDALNQDSGYRYCTSITKNGQPVFEAF